MFRSFSREVRRNRQFPEWAPNALPKAKERLEDRFHMRDHSAMLGVHFQIPSLSSVDPVNRGLVSRSWKDLGVCQWSFPKIALLWSGSLRPLNGICIDYEGPLFCCCIDSPSVRVSGSIGGLFQPSKHQVYRAIYNTPALLPLRFCEREFSVIYSS